MSFVPLLIATTALETAATELARDGKALVHIDGGLHSTEVAGAQHTPLLAYELISKATEPRPQEWSPNLGTLRYLSCSTSRVYLPRSG
jgi:hypothetical protein